MLPLDEHLDLIDVKCLGAASPLSMTVGCCFVELIVCFVLHTGNHARAAGDVGALFFLALLIWQVYTTRMGLGHVILAPTPEAVFHVFRREWPRMLQGIGSSLSLLATGFAISLPLGTVLGLLAGWNRRLREVLVPVGRVMAPIPAIIYAPYRIALMPSFRSASAMALVVTVLNWGSIPAGKAADPLGLMFALEGKS